MSLAVLLQEMEEISRMEMFAVASNGSFRRLLKVRIAELNYQIGKLNWDDAHKLQHQYGALSMQKDELEQILDVLDRIFKEFGQQMPVSQDEFVLTTTAAQENGNASESL